MSSDIKTLIRSFIKIDDEISTVNKQVKELRVTKVSLESQIKDYMIENDIAKVDIGSGNLRITKSKPSKKINKKTIMDVLLDCIEEEKASSIIEELYKDDGGEEVTKLERSKKS